ncbi:MAG TPA: tetratricopeptide repeat protein [Stellaceae bacterium]|jgi:tetratricopeptide (TPR) repeat protein|nr:tetratricopeptide repeat protein [Stellaceae bacterium]
MRAWIAGLWLIVVALIAPPLYAEDTTAAAVERLTAGLTAAEAHDGKTSPALLPALAALAHAEWRAGALADATASRRRALKITIAAFGCGSAEVAEAMAAVADVEIDRRRYLDAEPLLTIATRMLAARAGNDAAGLARMFAGLSRIALARGDTGAAKIWADRAVDIARRTASPGSAEPLRMLGAVQIAAGRFDAAENVLTEALTQDRRVSGASSDDTARSLSQLAHLYFRQGKVNDALPLIEQATAIDQRHLGAVHPFIADDLYDLGLAYAALKRNDAARNAFSKAVSLLEQGDSKETPRIAYAQTQLSNIYRAEGNTAAADAAFKNARRILNNAESEEHRRERRV